MVVVGTVAAVVSSTKDTASRAKLCTLNNNEVAKIDCWYDIIRDTFETDGTKAAFEVFEHIYREYDTFSDTGCHRHAHRVGDMAYYFDYLNHQDFDKTEFPPNATSCGYGFYHGFFEHLIQDHPDPAFVTETCEYMKDRLSGVAPAISQTCYHGSGHGFILARADKLIDKSDWSIQAFIDEPLNKCESLPKAEQREIEECRQGIYNVLVDWMADEEYGLVYDEKAPFTMCDQEPYDRQPDCYYEMAQKVDSVSGGDPVKVVDIANVASRKDLRGVILVVAVAGMVQHNPKGDQKELLEACRLVEGELFNKCIAGIIGGLLEHDTSSDNYQGAFTFCGRPDLTENEAGKCYEALSIHIKRFRTDSQLGDMCSQKILEEAFCRLL